MGRIIFGQRYRTGIEVVLLCAKRLPCRDMCMAVQQDVPWLQRRQLGYIVHMAVCGEEQMAADRE